MRESLDEAKARCQEGGGRRKEDDNVLRYVDGHPLAIPPFLLLTSEERAAVRGTYPWAAPSAAKVQAAETKVGRQDARNLSDPSTAKFLEVLASKVGEPSVAAVASKPGATERPRAAGGGSTTREARQAVDLPQDGVLARARDGNPKKEGSAAHRRWALMFEHCERGSTVREFLAAGGNAETLRNATLKGFAQVINKEGKK
jgi:hypothetical protein